AIRGCRALAGDGVKAVKRHHLLLIESYAVYRPLIDRHELQGVPNAPELAGGEVRGRALEVDADELSDKRGAVLLLPHQKLHMPLLILGRRPEAVYRRDRGDDDDV